MATNKPIFRKRKSGVTRIVRDSYGKKGDWFALATAIKKRDGYKCIFCGAPEQPKKGIFHDVHHIIRLADGGTNARSNLGTTCDTCHEKRPKHSHMKNNSKKDKPISIPTVVIISKFSNWRTK